MVFHGNCARNVGEVQQRGALPSPVDCQRQSVKCNPVSVCRGIPVEFVVFQVSFVRNVGRISLRAVLEKTVSAKPVDVVNDVDGCQMIRRTDVDPDAVRVIEDEQIEPGAGRQQMLPYLLRKDRGIGTVKYGMGVLFDSVEECPLNGSVACRIPCNRISADACFLYGSRISVTIFRAHPGWRSKMLPYSHLRARSSSIDRSVSIEPARIISFATSVP